MFVSGGEATFHVAPSSVDRKIPYCSVPIQRSLVEGLSVSANAALPLVEVVVAAVTDCPPLVEYQAPLVGNGAQYPPHTGLPFAAKAQPVHAGEASSVPA